MSLLFTFTSHFKIVKLFKRFPFFKATTTNNNNNNKNTGNQERKRSPQGLRVIECTGKISLLIYANATVHQT